MASSDNRDPIVARLPVVVHAIEFVSADHTGSAWFTEKFATSPLQHASTAQGRSEQGCIMACCFAHGGNVWGLDALVLPQCTVHGFGVCRDLELSVWDACAVGCVSDCVCVSLTEFKSF